MHVPGPDERCALTRSAPAKRAGRYPGKTKNLQHEAHEGHEEHKGAPRARESRPGSEARTHFVLFVASVSYVFESAPQRPPAASSLCWVPASAGMSGMIAVIRLSGGPLAPRPRPPLRSHPCPALRAGVADASRAFIYDADSAPALWTPHRPARPEKCEGGRRFELVSDYAPAGDQPEAIARAGGRRQRARARPGAAGRHRLGQDLHHGADHRGDPASGADPGPQQDPGRPALLASSSRFFPDNAVEYFVSYYDYYQPEAYVPRTDTYIEKDSSLNEQIDRMRHSATRAILERDDVIVVASVSCIYGIGSVETYSAMTFTLKVGEKVDEKQLMADLVAQQYKRNDNAFERGTFRRRGDTIEIFPAHYEDRAWRVTLFGDEVEAISEFDPLTGKKTAELTAGQGLRQQPLRHARARRCSRRSSLIKAELKERLDWLVARGQAAGGAAAGAAHHLRPGDDRGHRQLRRHRELQPLPHRPPPRRAAADLLRIHPRQRPAVRRREPPDRAADRRHVPRRLPAQVHPGRVRLPPALAAWTTAR